MLPVLLSLCMLLPQPQDKIRQEIAISEDGYTSLPVRYYTPPFAGAPMVVIVHDWGGTADNWSDTASFLQIIGYSVLLFDMRGHGGATTAYYYFKDSQVAGMLEDVRLALEFGRGKNPGTIHLIGAGLGANLALAAAAEDGNAGKVIAISPGLNYRGIRAGDALGDLDPEGVLLLASQEDVYSVHSIRELLRLYPVERKIYQSAGHGVWMLKRQPEIRQENADWLR